MPRLSYSTAARRDLASIQRYLTKASTSVAVGRRFVLQLQQKCEALARLPGTMGRARPELRPDMRSFAFRDYVIFFRYVDNVFEVVNILEGHRDIDTYYRNDQA